MSWREPSYVAAIREVASSDQFNRFKRIYREPFYVLESDAPCASYAASLLVSGSTPRSSYRVRILRESGRVTCTCMDAAVNCARVRCVCKHACFAAVRVFALDAASVSRWFRSGLRLAPEDVAAIAERAIDTTTPLAGEDAPDIDALCRRLDRVGIGSRVDFSVVSRPPEAGDECPVCYDELKGGGRGAALVGCPDCGKAVHEGCASRWLAHAARPTCVYCRSPAWSGFLV